MGGDNDLADLAPQLPPGFLRKTLVGNKGVDIREVGHGAKGRSTPLGMVRDDHQTPAAGYERPVRLGFGNVRRC